MSVTLHIVNKNSSVSDIINAISEGTTLRLERCVSMRIFFYDFTNSAVDLYPISMNYRRHLVQFYGQNKIFKLTRNGKLRKLRVTPKSVPQFVKVISA